MIYIGAGVTDTDKPVVLYDNLFTQGTLSGVADPDFPVGNAVTGTTWDFWKPDSPSIRSITVDLGASATADCAFIDAHELATVGASVRVQTSTDGVSWSSASQLYTPTDNSPIMIIFSPASSRYWRIIQTDGPAAVGVVMLGERLTFEYGFSDPVSFNHGKQVEVMGGNSLGGHFLGQKIRRKGGNTSFNFPWLSADWVNNEMAMFETHYNEGKPFAMALRPNYDDEELAYCWRPDGASELRPSYQVNGRAMTVDMQVDYYVGT